MLYQALQQLQAHLAELSTWQAWTGSANASEALAHTYLLTVPEEATLPLCLIDWAAEYTRERAGISPAAPWTETGTVLLYIRAPDSESVADHLANLDALLKEMGNQAGLGGRLNITLQKLQDGPQRVPPEDADRWGNHWESLWQIDWAIR